MRLVFLGTPQFAVPTLAALLRAGHSVELVVSQPDRPSGRGLDVRISPVKQFALDHALPLLQPERLRDNPSFEQRLTAIRADAFVIVAYGKLIPPWMLALPRYGNLNLHASLLPKLRGAAPIQWAVASGASETGVTAMRIDAGLDTGDILLAERVPILPSQTAVDLSPILAAAGAELMVRTLAGLAACTVHAVPQDHSQATLAPMLQREDGRIHWARAAMQIYNRWRGFQPWPGAFATFRGKKLSIHAMRVAESGAVPLPPTAPMGTLVPQEHRLFAVCGANTWLELTEVQAEGKRRMPVAAFLNGVSIAAGERLD